MDNLNPPFDTYNLGSVEKINYSDVTLLIVGVGGLGTEVLRILNSKKFKSVHILDMDRVELSNLNRQSMYSENDIGRPKVEVAAEAIYKSRKCGKTEVFTHFKSLKDLETEFYDQFDIILCGLDSYDARRWLNAAILQLKPKKFYDRPYYKPILIDGASEGLTGSVRIILPRINACYECTLGLEIEPKKYPICTVANTPRQPEHCVESALILQWPKENPGVEYDSRNQDHVMWVLKKSMEIAKKHCICGLTPKKAYDILLSIIPSSVTTNSIVASLMVIKLHRMLQGDEVIPEHPYITYSAMKSVSICKYNIERLSECPLCGIDVIVLCVNHSITLEGLMKMVSEDSRIRMTNISIRSSCRTLYMQAPRSLRDITAKNLGTPISELVSDGSLIYITGSAYCHSIKVMLRFRHF